MFLTLMAGKMALDYDITRSGGAISASFGADRTYVNFTGEYRLEAAGSTSVFTGGLRYVEQSDEGYTEDGGGVVDAATGTTLSVVFGSRTAIEVASSFKPFIETDLRYDIEQDMVPYVVDHLPDGRMAARLGIGVSRDTGNSTFEAGLGTNFGEDGYNGLDAKLRLTLRF
jgi:outer membrane autotransporter protein